MEWMWKKGWMEADMDGVDGGADGEVANVNGDGEF